MEPVISIRNLHKDYGKNQALRGLNFEVEKGVIYGLLGPNGAGKSTMIKALVGAVKPTSGEVQVLGLKLPENSYQTRSRLGYMPQSPALYGDLSIRENIRFFAGAHRLKNLKNRLEEVLEFVGLNKLSERKVSPLSGGLKQRCSLACALIHDPEILLLDEPTAGVDPVLKEGFWKHFKELTANGVTIIISTHLMDEPLSCDRLGILREGSLIINDTPEGIMARGRTRITIENEDNVIQEEVEDYEAELPVILQRYGLAQGVGRIEVERESLEDIFLKLIRSEEANS